MRIWFYKEVTSPNMELRNTFLSKLAKVRGVPGLQEYKRFCKDVLDRCNGSVNYFLFYKGLRIPVGDETMPKKNFLVTKTNEFLKSVVREHRLKVPSGITKRRHIKSIDDYVYYNQDQTGVMSEFGTFVKMHKTIGRKKVFASKKPQTVDSYIGLELEYASRLTLEEVADLIVQAGLQDKVRAMNDSSIQLTSKFNHRIELCILTKYSELSTTLSKLKEIIKPELFQANKSCGLHVHLDVRATGPDKVYQNLVFMQNILFQLADESRRENRYCHFVDEHNFGSADSEDHYAAISKSSWYKHKSIEVRIHHSTTDLTLVEKWVNLLKRIADYQGNDLTFGSMTDGMRMLKSSIKIEQDLINYIEEKIAL